MTTFATGLADSAVVFFGPTQASKSTTFNFLSEGAEGPSEGCGDGSGESVTVETSLRISQQLGFILDTPGINDSKLRFTNAEAGKKVAVGVAARGVRRVKFLIFESMANDAVALRSTLLALLESFGPSAPHSAVVLAAKADAIKREKREKRAQVLRDICGQQGIRHVVVWQNEEINETGRTAQLRELQHALGDVPAVETNDLEDLTRRALERARKLCDQAPARQEEVSVEVNEQYVEPREEWEECQEQYVDHVDETYNTVEPYETTEEVRRVVPVIESSPWLCQSSRVRLTLGIRTETETNKVIKERIVQNKRQVPVQRTRTAKRKKIAYDVKTRTRTETKTVPVCLSPEDFMAQAWQEVTEELRQTLSHP